MNLPTTEQLVHDRINLGRLVKRLEMSTQNDNWNQLEGNSAWIKAQGSLQVSSLAKFPMHANTQRKRIKHARQLLKNVEADDPYPSSP